VEELAESHCKAVLCEGFKGLSATEVSRAKAAEQTHKMRTINSPGPECIFSKGLQQFTDEITELLRSIKAFG